jgi:hypothetical protein
VGVAVGVAVGVDVGAAVRPGGGRVWNLVNAPWGGGGAGAPSKGHRGKTKSQVSK